MLKNKKNPFLSSVNKDEKINNFALNIPSKKKEYNLFNNGNNGNNNNNNYYINSDDNKILEKIKELKKNNIIKINKKNVKKIDITKLIYQNNDKQYNPPDMNEKDNINNNVFLQKKQQKSYLNKFLNETNIDNPYDNIDNDNLKSNKKQVKYEHLSYKYDNF